MQQQIFHTLVMQIGYIFTTRGKTPREIREGNCSRFEVNSPWTLGRVTHSTHLKTFPKFVSLISLLLHGSHFNLQLCLPVMFSTLGIIPCKGADKQSSSCDDTWTATSRGWHALRECWWWVRECDEDVERGEASGEDGGLSRGLSVQRLPWHCLRLCSMNSRMSARGKREWHWPQVSRSWSPLRRSPGATPSLGESWESSSGKTPDSGSAGWTGEKKECEILYRER